MLGAAAVDEEMVQTFGPRAEETEQCCCPSHKADMNPGQLLTCQVCMALGAGLSHLCCRVFWDTGPCCLLVPSLCCHLKLLVTVVSHLQLPPCPPLLWSQARIAVCRASLVRAQPNWRKAYSLGLDYSVL